MPAYILLIMVGLVAGDVNNGQRLLLTGPGSLMPGLGFGRGSDARRANPEERDVRQYVAVTKDAAQRRRWAPSEPQSHFFHVAGIRSTRME